VFWELDPVAHERAVEAGDTEFEKESWVSATLLEWGSCGKIAYVDSVPAGYVMYSPPMYVPRSIAFPTSPVSADAVLLMTGMIMPEFQGGGLGRMLIQGVAKDLQRRGIKAIEAFVFRRGARTLEIVVRPRRSFAALGLGALVGVVGGWLAGLLRAPRKGR
jgi:GNAT superfamily N-acetyltransferase